MKNNMILSFILCLSSTFLFAQPTADFTVNVTEGCSPLEVNFTNASTGSSLTYAWNFGEGSTSTTVNPTFIYDIDGEFTVCLTITDDQGLDDEICKTDFITVYPTDESYLGYSLCSGDFLEIEGIVFNESNPIGEVVYTNSSGCDSTVYVDLTFYPIASTAIVDQYCANEIYVFSGNGLEYTAGIHTITLLGESYTGCDSIVFLDLTELPVYEVDLIEYGCPDDSQWFCGQWCATGLEFYLDCGTSSFGCDSFVNLVILPYPEGTYDLTATLCNDEILNVAGTIYDVNNSTGVEVIEGGSIYGCDSIINVDLTFAPAGALLFSNIQIQDETCIGADGSICFDVTCGVEPYNYLWSTGATDMCQSNLVAGTYTVIVTDMDGNTAEQNFIVESGAVISYSATYTDVSCNGGNDGSIQLNDITGSCEPYNIEWSNGAIGDNITNLGAWTYTVTVTDCSGCSQVNFYTISEPTPINANVNISSEIFCNGGNACVDASNTTGGLYPYTYDWSNGDLGEFICSLPAGTQSVTITDSNGCTSTSTFDITEPSPLSLVADDIQCATTGQNNGSISLDSNIGGTCCYSFLWSNNQTSQDIDNLSADIYSVTVTDNNSCTADASFEVVDDLSITNVVIANPSCNGNSDGEICFDVSCGTPPYLYEWSEGGIPVVNCFDGFGAGVYEVTITDANSDFIVESFTLIETSTVVPTISGPTSACEGEEIFLCGNPVLPGYTYTWTGPSGFSSTLNCPSVTMDVSLAGCYTLSMADPDGCAVQEVTHCVDVTSFSDVVNTPIANASICEGVSHQFNVDAPTAVGITWTPAIGLSCSDCFDPIASPAVTTTYEVVIESADGCFLTSEVVVNVSEQPVISIPDMSICEGSAFNACASVFVAGADMESWEWILPDGTIVTDDCLDILEIDSDDSGSYTLNVTFVGGCTANTAFTMLVETVDFTISDDVTICVDAIVSLEVSGPNVTDVTWTPEDGSMNCNECPDPVAQPLVTTTYTALISSFGGCFAEGQVTVTVNHDCVWPGDTDTNKVVNNFDLLNIGLAYDSIGPLRANANLMWVGQESPDWMQTAPNGFNYKHIDTDGNGLIDANDTLAISQNWGDTHNFTGEDDSAFIPTYPPSSGVSVTVPFYVEPDTLIEGESISLPIILGESGNPAENVYGIAFTLEYDTAVIVPGSVSIGFNQSWLGENNDDLISIHRDFFNDNQVDIGMTRIDGAPMTDFGTLASLFITVEDDLLFGPGGSSSFTTTQSEALFNITNVLVINELGEEIPVITTETTAPVLTTTTSTNKPELGSNISIYPNPATDLLWVNSKNIKLNKIELLNINGQKVNEIEAPDTQQKIDLSRLGVGTYFVKVYSDEGVYVERVALMR